MKQSWIFESRVAPLPVDNIDTDQIIPARFLKTVSKEGLGSLLFYDWRYDAEGRPRPGFVLNQSRYRQARILLAGGNFGCGSSREHAPWALRQFGFRAVISTSFADIFRQNAVKNSLLPVVVSDYHHQALVGALSRAPELTLTIDLQNQLLTLPGELAAEFPVDGFTKKCLLEAIDEIDYVLRFESEISAYESAAAD